MIKFGTDGWRAIISDEFTFENVQKVAKAIAKYIIDHKLADKPLIIGYDPRFLADKFAQTSAKIMEDAGINCYLTERDTPTPIVAWEVVDRKACGAIMFTASHNPAEYCGIKFIPAYAGPANEEITAELQENSNRDIVLPKPAKKGEVERFEPRERYFNYIKSFIDPDLIKKARLKVVYDPMHGAGRGYVDRLLQDLGVEVAVINGGRDVLFGGRSPEPTGENLKELEAKVVELRADCGLANDGDADRFGVVDERGDFLNANQVFALVFDYLVSNKGYTGSVVRSVATTHLIDLVAKHHKIAVYETPVGFKHIAKLMLAKDIIIGGEESGGLSIKGHIPEKDGILADLLIVEMLAKKKKPLSQIYQDLISKVGVVLSERVNLKFSGNDKEKFMDKLLKNTPTEFAGLKVKEVNKLDGAKLILEDGSWVLARPSGTEPLIRVYAEAPTPQKVAALLKAVKDFV
ncbi:MAG: phosphoglucomutase/phosphomannomutase family protein [Candidatus Saganbacteria bacterium]|nr:phosphoglucomutase/phosphomannomutase family protein [Candidatus Saganbacteria bacterium]